MNSTYLRALLAALPVSRTTFFTKLLVEPSAQSGTIPDELAADHDSEPAAPLVAPVQPPIPTTSFPA